MRTCVRACVCVCVRACVCYFRFKRRSRTTRGLICPSVPLHKQLRVNQVRRPKEPIYPQPTQKERDYYSRRGNIHDPKCRRTGNYHVIQMKGLNRLPLIDRKPFRPSAHPMDQQWLTDWSLTFNAPSDSEGETQVLKPQRKG